MMTQHRILFVCLGNICRSPLAEAAMRRLIAEEDRLDDFLLGSAGLSANHAGQSIDPRAIKVAAAHGMDLRGERSRQVTAADFKNFDLLLAMDVANRDALRAMAPRSTEQKAHLLLEFSSWIGESEIPDPYHGSLEDFEDAFDLIQLAARGLLAALDQADGELSVPVAPRARLKVSSAR